jgi:hypothetical protein
LQRLARNEADGSGARNRVRDARRRSGGALNTRIMLLVGTLLAVAVNPLGAKDLTVISWGRVNQNEPTTCPIPCLGVDCLCARIDTVWVAHATLSGAGSIPIHLLFGRSGQRRPVQPKRQPQDPGLEWELDPTRQVLRVGHDQHAGLGRSAGSPRPGRDLQHRAAAARIDQAGG